MTDFREELIEAGARAGGMYALRHASEDWSANDSEYLSVILDAMLAHRSTVECPECGGTGTDACGISDAPCDAGCIDGRVPGETRLAIVERQVGFYHDQYGFEGMKHGIEGDENSGSPVFLLAPDLPEEST